MWWGNCRNWSPTTTLTWRPTAARSVVSIVSPKKRTTLYAYTFRGCVWSFLRLDKSSRNTDSPCEARVQFLQEGLRTHAVYAGGLEKIDSNKYVAGATHIFPGDTGKTHSKLSIRRWGLESQGSACFSALDFEQRTRCTCYVLLSNAVIASAFRT